MTVVVPAEKASDDDLALLAELQTIVDQERVPDDPAHTLPEVAAELRNPPSYHRMSLVVDGEDGVGALYLDRRGTNEHLGWFELWVRPSARRRGAGSRILDAMRETARADGRNVLIVEGVAGDVATETFARHHGFTPGLLIHQNRLRTSAIDRTLMDRWIDDAATAARDYRLLAWDGLPPDEAYAQISACAQAMQDAPTSDAMDPDWNHTPENERDDYAAWVAQDWTVWTLAAQHVPTGEMAGYTQLLVNRHRPTLADQENTGVLPGHRGHGLGRWLKAVNALRLLDEQPQVEQVLTGNAASNGPMLAINHAMGFTPALTFQGWELSI